MDYRSFTAIEFSITTYCQAACPLCARTNADTLKTVEWLELTHYNIEDYKNILSQIPKAVTRIKLCGDYGDPMMHPDIELFIKETMKYDLKLTMHTNGGLRDEEWYTKIGNTYGKNVKITFSIDGLDKETNSKYRINVNFNKAWKNMLAYNAAGGHTAWDFLMFSYNINQVPDAFKIAWKTDIDVYFKLNNRNWKYNITDKHQIELASKYMYLYIYDYKELPEIA